MDKVDRALRMARETGRFSLRAFPLNELPHALSKIPDLHSISVNSCQLRSLPGWLADLEITSLDLASNSFDSFPNVITRLPKLRELGMSQCRIYNIPTEIGSLSALESLVLPGCELETIPPSIASLTRLVELDLGFNEVIDIAPDLFPSSIEHLILSGNPLVEVPESVASLAHLRVLELSANGSDVIAADKTNLKPLLPKLTGLSTRLVARRRNYMGRIREIPDWLYELNNLEWIDLANNQIGRISSDVAQLTKLRGLVLSGNVLRSVPSEVFSLDSLQVLALAGNALETLPEELPNVPQLRYLDLNDNPLPIPPEVLSQPDSPRAIWNYIALIRQDKRPLDEAKLLVVGEGAVGKSSIIRRLTQGDFDSGERKTEGIEVTRWSLPVNDADIAVNVWDFGGQEIMHATHQFFLTRRSVYLLVIDARQSEEQNRVEYWLKLIQGFSAGSPVILVGNKCEDFGLDIDQRGLSAKYPDIVGIIETSCATNLGMKAVRQTLIDTIGRLTHIRDPLPAAFFAVKEYIEHLDADYLAFTDYVRLCAFHGVDTPHEQELLVDFLHDLGTVLCFRNDPRLRDTNILNPSWVTGGVYRLLNSHLAAQVKGLLSWREVDTILDSQEYPPDKRQFIIGMMKKFELCFESEDIFLVPDLLTKEEPDTGYWEGALHFQVRYDVLPSSIIGRLIVRMHRLISRGTVWRTGVVLTLDNNRALVKADREEALITIRVSGPTPGRRGLLTAIRAELRAIERTIPGLASEEQVPVPGHPNIWVPYMHLLSLEAAGREAVIPQGTVEEFRISDLLDGIEDRADRERIRSVGEVEMPASHETRSVEATDGSAWTPSNALLFGGLLVIAIVVVFGAYAAVSKFVGRAEGAAVVTVVLIVLISLVVLRAAGRVSERTMFKGIKKALYRLGDAEHDAEA